MAKKRLNKKVAIIGSAFFVLFVLFAIVLILYLNRNPEKFIKDADAALLAEDYKTAEDNYRKAYGLAKTDMQKVELFFKLAKLYQKTERWRDVMGCWNEVIRIDPKNIEARFGRLNYLYIMADSGAHRGWQEVASQASELMEVAEQRDLFMEDTAQWDCFEVRQKRAGPERLGPYLYLVRGRAIFEATRMGAFADPDESLARAIDDLKKVQELEPSNVNASWYLAQAVITKGEILTSRGEFEEGNKTVDSAVELLERAVEVAGADPRAHVNLLSAKLMVVRRGGAGLTEEQIQPLEPQYLSLVEKFPSSAEAFSALAGFYRLRFKNLDKAIKAAEKAVELDKENVRYIIGAAALHYRKFSIYGQKPELHKAIQAARNALTLPDAQDKPGPRQWTHRTNRILLYELLAECYIGQVMKPWEVTTETNNQELLTEAEQVVREIDNLLGKGDSPQVVKWRGMLELARGNRSRAIRKLYAAYQQLKAAKPSKPPLPRDPQYARLSYTLAKLFQNTSEVGAVGEFMVNALYSGIVETRPEAILDYAEVALKRNLWAETISNINVFEQYFWANERSQTLRIKAFIRANQFDEAEKELAKRKTGDPNTIKLNLALVQTRIRQVLRAVAQRQMKGDLPAILQDPATLGKEPGESEDSLRLMRAELKNHWRDLAKLMEELLQIEPNSVRAVSVVAVCNNYIAEGKTSEATELVDTFLEYFPDNTSLLFYKQWLSEPEPGKISQERRKEIEEQVLSSIADPVRRALGLGRFYHRHNEVEKAAVEFRKVFKIDALREAAVEKSHLDRTQKITDSRRLAANYLFEISLAKKDWEQAQQIVEAVSPEDLDGCEGQFFAARLAAAKAEYKNALTKLEDCLKQRPVFSAAYMLKSKINAALGNEHSSVEDAKRAASLNPLDGTIAKGLAFVLYRRDRKLSDNVSANQLIETGTALRTAVALNPQDIQLRSFYAEYIGSTETSKALAIRQYLQKVAPSAENALLLGRMAIRMALREAGDEKKEALFAIAGSSLEQARALDPQDNSVLEAQAEYYRLTGQPDKARELLIQSNDRKLLWAHYLRSGKFEDAKEVLEQLHKSDANDADVVKGLLLVAEKTADDEAVKKYSERLLLLEDSVSNRLIQIQTFLKTGLVKEAEYKLQSFSEKFPDEPRALLFEAWLAMKQGQLKKALELINRSLATKDNNPLAWRLRGQVNFLTANYDQAIDDLRTSKSLLPAPPTRLALAKAYLRIGRDEDAITELKSTIDHPQASTGEAAAALGARVLLEKTYLQLDRKAALKNFYDETLAKLPDSVHWHNRAGALAIAQREFDRAEQFYKEAMRIANSKNRATADSPDDKQLATSLDGYLQALVLGAGTPNTRGSVWNPAKLSEVFEEGRKYVDGDFAPVAYLRMAEAKMKLADKATATEYCRKAVQKAFAGTDETLASKALRGMHSLLGAKEVLQYCEQRLKTNPDSLAANLTMFSLMKINGEYNKALAYIDKCLEVIGPDSPRTLNYMLRKVTVLDLAYSKTSDNNYLKRAIALYESLSDKMPNNTIVLNNLAYMLAKNDERLADALKHAKRAYEARPNNPGFLDTYAYVLYKNGRNSEADEFLHAALQQYEHHKIPVPAAVYENLGLIKEALGAKAEALAAYKQALEKGADELSQPAIERTKSAIERLSQ